MYPQHFFIGFFLVYFHILSIVCYEVDFPKFLIDFLKTQQKSVHVNLYFEPQERMLMNNITKTLFLNGFQSSISMNDDDFLVHSHNGYREMKILNMDNQKSVDILKKAEKLGYLKAPYTWVLLGEISTIKPYNIYFRVDSKIFICEKTPSGYNVTTVHKVNKDVDEYQYNSIGLWTAKDGFVHYNNLSIYKTRRNLMGTEFRMSYLFNSPITYKTVFQYRMTHIDSSARFTFLITQILISIFNVTPSYIIQTSYGNPNPNSSAYTGLIGDIMSGRAVMGATPVLMNPKRISLLEYIAPNTRCDVNFFFRLPRLSYVSNIFVKPFDEYVWYSCFIMVALTFGTMYAILSWEWKEPYFKSNNENTNNAMETAIGNVAILQLAVISQQGADTELKSSSGRIAMIFSLVAFMFLYTAYSANIVALLQSTSNSIKDVQDLLDSGIRLGVEKTPYFKPFFKNPSDPLGRKMYEKKLKSKGDEFMMSLAEGTKKMRNEFFAFFTEASSINKLISDQFEEAEKCSLRRVQHIRIKEPWFVTQKNGSYMELLKIGLLRIREVGFYMAERRRIFYENPTCETKISRFFSAGLIDVYPGFLFFGVGCFISLLVLLCEILLEKVKISKRKPGISFFKMKKAKF